MLKSPSPLPIEIKISTVVAISTILYSADPLAIDAALKQMTGGVSDFFEDEFAVIDVTTIADSAPQVEWDKLVAVLKKYRLNAVAVRVVCGSYNMLKGFEHGGSQLGCGAGD